jgi:hypothetical protein
MRLPRTAVASVLAAVVLSGCGAAEKVSPQVAVRNAANSTVNAKGGTYTFSIVGSEDDLNAVVNKEGAALSDEDRRGLRLLGTSHVAISTGPEVFGLDVKVGEIDHAVEIRYVGKKLYARADVPALVKLMEASPDEVAATMQGLEANGFGFLKDFAAGQWLVADLGPLGDMLKGFAEQFGGAEKGSATPTSSAPTPGQFQQARDAVGKALRDNTSVDRQKSDATGDHYLVTLTSIRGLYAALLPVVSQFPLPAGNLPAANEIPDRPVIVDTWVKDGRIARIELPLNQFAAGNGRVAVRLDIDREVGNVTAPPDAVAVDVAGIMRKFVQGLSGLGGLNGLPGMGQVPGLNIPGLTGTTS